jgi:hypothetical protein
MLELIKDLNPDDSYSVRGPNDRGVLRH